MQLKSLSFKKQDEFDLFFSVFYTFGFLALLSLRPQIYERANMIEGNGLTLASFHFLPDNQSLKLIFFATLFVQLMTAFLPQFFSLRAITAYAWYLLIYSIYSFGDFSHEHFGWLAVHFVFMIPSKLISAPKIVSGARAFCLSIYFNAGMWKLRGLFLNHADHWWSDVSGTLSHHIARTFCEGVLASTELMLFLQNHYYLAGVFWLTIIALQLSSIIILFLPKYDFFWGWLIIFFHVGTAVVLGVDFTVHLYLIFLVFFVSPAILAPKHHSNIGCT